MLTDSEMKSEMLGFPAEFELEQTSRDSWTLKDSFGNGWVVGPLNGSEAGDILFRIKRGRTVTQGHAFGQKPGADEEIRGLTKFDLIQLIRQKLQESVE